MNGRRHSVHLTDVRYHRNPQKHGAPLYQNIEDFQNIYEISNDFYIPNGRKQHASQRMYLPKTDSSLKRRIARTQSERRAPGPPEQSQYENIHTPHGKIYENTQNSRSWTMSLERRKDTRSCGNWDGNGGHFRRPLHNEHVSCVDLRRNHDSPSQPKMSSSCNALNEDLEYGPGIVERLRAKFSRLSGNLNNKQNEKNEPDSQKSKRYLSCDDLLSENDPPSTRLPNGVFSPKSDLSRQQSYSISDMLASPPVESERVFTVHRSINIDEDSENGITSISALKKKFETIGPVVAPDRVYRDSPKGMPIRPVQPEYAEYVPPQPFLIQTSTPRQLEPVVNFIPEPIPTLLRSTPPTHTAEAKNLRVNEAKLKNPPASVLNVLNDAKSDEIEPEFVQIARRLRRFETKTSENSKYTDDAVKPASAPAFWHRRKPELPVLGPKARIIREVSDYSNVLPPDPYPPRVSSVSKVMQINKHAEFRQFPGNDSSPPPEEPSPSVNHFSNVESSRYQSVSTNSQFRFAHLNGNPQFELKEGVGQSEPTQTSFEINKDHASESIKSPPISTQMPPPAKKLPPTFVFARLAPQSTAPPVPSQAIPPMPSTPASNVVSINVRAPAPSHFNGPAPPVSTTTTKSNVVFSNYDKSESSGPKSAPKSSPAPISNFSNNTAISSFGSTPLFTPTYNNFTRQSIDHTFGSKFTEENSHKSPLTAVAPEIIAPTSTFSTGILSPNSREKPYGDDVTILKSGPAVAKIDDDEFPQRPTSLPSFLPRKMTKIRPGKDSEESASSDEEGRVGSYDLTTSRPSSLSFISKDEEIGGDGNYISRSLISLVAEEDLPEFLVAMHEKPLNIQFEQDTKPSTSSILRNSDPTSVKVKTGPRIRFSPSNLMAYTYIDESTAYETATSEWPEATIVEYSYFQKLADMESTQTERDLNLLQRWQEEVAGSKNEKDDPEFTRTTNTDSTFIDSHNESALSPAY
ncbi:unnamed protein product [Caenorhabditis auriculariae]|uniref:Uncharacterized protein n=1 Tax=Caenorhabditis auriculariae TaxID=2777116 RepID=A0A8S1GQQ2_9PELO|nr:unnamed protein product [Caenorhabditis auriculariae]